MTNDDEIDAAESLRENYLATRITIHLGQGKVFETSDQAPSNETWPFQQPYLCVITAWNPRSLKLEYLENTLLNDQLRRDLESRNIQFFDCTGSAVDRSWYEDGFAVLSLRLEDAVGLAQKYEQNAIFLVRDGVVRLIDCLDY
jgi:Protein of unknown function (DUF3293)